MIKTSVHQHNLIFFPNLPFDWSCSLSLSNENTKDTCLSKHTAKTLYRNSGVYYCMDCEFYLCEKDSEKFEVSQIKNNSEVTILSKKLIKEEKTEVPSETSPS